MLPKIPSPPRLLRQEESGRAVGLGILAEISPTTSSTSWINAYNVVMNSTPILPNFSSHTEKNSNNSTTDYYCFLKSCYLCNKTLRLDKEVYMYRGDVGFCSIECRNRQIYVDEMREIEISTKKTLASIRRCRNSSNPWRDTSSQEEYRQRRRRPYKKNQAIFI